MIRRGSPLRPPRTQGELAGSAFASAAIADAGRQLAYIAAEVAMLEERWVELQQQLDSLAAATR